MIGKLFCTTTALLAGLVLWGPVHTANPGMGYLVGRQREKADPKPKPNGTRVFIKCEWESLGESQGTRYGRAVITNNTSSPMPVGTIIRWSVGKDLMWSAGAAAQGQITLTQSLPIGAIVRSPRQPESGDGAANPRAWYLK